MVKALHLGNIDLIIAYKPHVLIAIGAWYPCDNPLYYVENSAYNLYCLNLRFRNISGY